MTVDRTCIKDEPRLSLRDGTPMGDRRKKEARKTQNHMEENYGVGKVNARMEIEGTSANGLELVTRLSSGPNAEHQQL